MNIIVSKDIVKLNENHSENHYGEYNVNECVFEFDEYFDSVPIKKAIFTSQSNNKSFEIDIINNKCTVPHEVLTKVYDTVILGVYGYDVNEETLLVRYSPEPTTFVVHEGSYREGAEQPEIIKPTQYDMYSKALQEGLTEVDKRLNDVEKQGHYASEQGNYAKEQGDYAKEQGNYAKEQKIEVVKANEEANRIINNFETNVSEYTTAFNENVANKTKEFNANVSAKTSAFDNNAVLKTEEFNENANSKKTDFNLNANNRTTEFDTNVANQTKTFNDNASDRLVEYNQNDTTKTNTFNSNANSKTETYNNNHTEKLNAYNTNADTKLQEYNDNATLKEEEYNSNATAKMEEFNQIASDYDQRITANEEYLDTITPKQTAKGELVHITDALPLPTFENKVDGNVKQETTKGTNYFNAYAIKNSGVVVEDNGKTIKMPISDSNGYTYAAAILSKLCPNLKVGDEVYLYFTRNLGTGYNNYIYLDGNTSLWSNGTKKVITQEMLDGAVGLYDNNAINGNETTQCILTDFRIVKEQDAPWEKFTNNQQTPNPSYPQEIEVIEGSVGVKVNGKNLFNKDNVEVGKYINENGEVTSYYAYSLSDYIKIKPNTRYCYQGISDYSERGAFYDNNKVLISTFIESTLSNSYVDTPSNARYVRFSLINTNEDINKFMLEEGTQTTPYEPYQEQIVPLDLKGNFVGKINDNIKDYLVTDKKKLWLVKNVGKVVLDGSEEWEDRPNFNNCDRFVLSSTTIPAQIYSPLSNYFKCTGTLIDTIGYLIINGGTQIVINYSEKGTTTLAQFKTWLSTHNTILYYQLAEPQIIELGELPEPIKTFEGVNNIQVLANLDTEIEVKYGLDVKKYFENKLASIQEQIL